jgi:N-methylhydantoinase B/oxoprolinase/acetone carboxylase alpha subunit
VAGNTETHPRLVDIVIGALAQAVPERVQAAEGGTSCNFLFGGTHPETGQFYANYQFEGCGWGGRHDADGNNAVVVPNGNCRNTPVEVYETRYPFRTLSYRLVPGSAGPGRHRGGLGTERIVEVVPPAEITVSAVFERMRVHPWGLFGGGPAAGSAILLKRDGDDRFRTFQEVFGTVSPAKFANCVVHPGDQILLRSPGGGGYGPAGERDPELVRGDVEQGFVSPDEARDLYRVALRAVAGMMRFEVDPAETARLRAAVTA